MRPPAASAGSSGTLRRAGRCGAAALLLAGAAMPLLAQSVDPLSTSSAAPSPRTGGPGVAERGTVTFAVTGRYDSNVARLGDGINPGVIRVEGEDIRITPTVTLDVARNLGRHQIGLQSTLGYDFYTRNPSLNSERISVDPFAYLDLPVCDLYLAGSARRRNSNLGDLVVITPGNLNAAIENQETFRRASAQVTCGDQYGLRPGVLYEYTDGRNSNALRRFANFRSTRIQPSLSYSGPALGEISLYAVRTETDLPNQVNALGEPVGYITKGAGVGYRRAVGSRLTFDGSLSYVDLQPKSSTLDSRSGLNASVSLSVVASPRLQLVAFANRSFTSSLTSNAAYEIGESYGLTANYAASDRLRFRIGGQISPQRYVYDVLPPGPFITRQTQRDIFAGASYSLNRRMSITLDAGYQTREADVADFDYDNFFAAVGLVFRL